jgi:alkylhydroperoxidase/carboxymuconolactone decarboxylase family protein YurZ
MIYKNKEDIDHMDEITKKLVGIAASVAGHCRICSIYQFQQEKKCGIPKENIDEVVEIANRIMLSCNKGMHGFVYEILKHKNMENEI